MKPELKKLLILNAPYLLLEQSGKWGAKSKKEYLLDKDGQRIKLKTAHSRAVRLIRLTGTAKRKPKYGGRRGRILQTAILPHRTDRNA